MIEKKVVSLEKAVLIGVITKLQDETKSRHLSGLLYDPRNHYPMYVVLKEN